MTGTAALAAALAKVQAQLPEVDRDRTVTVVPKDPKKDPYSYSYVTLANLSKVILPLLAKHGLAYAALPGAGADGKMCLRYHLLHESGEQLSGEFPLSGEGGIQMIGGRITYARRYCLAALVGVAADEDDESRLGDDTGRGTAQRAAPRTQADQSYRDGYQTGKDHASAKPSARTAQRAAPPPLPSDGPRPYTPAQRAKLMASFGELGVADRAERLDICSRIVGRELSSANDLTLEEAKKVIDALTAASQTDNPMLALAEATARPAEQEGSGDDTA